MASRTKQTPSAAGDTPAPPWDVMSYTRRDTLGGDTISPLVALRDAECAWHRFLSQRPLLYLPDRSTHGRHLWRRDELLAFDAIVTQRTQTLLRHQHDVLVHWQCAATRLQAHARGLLARRRVERMRHQLYDAAMAAVHARALAALRVRQCRAAVRIQTVYHRHATRLHFLFICRQRVHRSIGRYVVRWQHHRAARVLQRAFRQYRRRVRLATAMRALLCLLRRSRQREALDAAAQAFHRARHEARRRECEQTWTRHPLSMATRKTALNKTVAPHARLPLLVRNARPVAPPQAPIRIRRQPLPPLRITSSRESN